MLYLFFTSQVAVETPERHKPVMIPSVTAPCLSCSVKHSSRSRNLLACRGCEKQAQWCHQWVSTKLAAVVGQAPEAAKVVLHCYPITRHPVAVSLRINGVSW